jgi:membrane-bound serine protease (ClpP class)
MQFALTRTSYGTTSSGLLRRRPWWRLALLLVWAAMLLLGFAGQATAAGPHAAVIKLDGIISPVTDRFLARSLDEARDNGATVVIVELDTPGGLLDSTRNMVNTIFASQVPVIVYVAPGGARAASAGTFITAAGHIAAMAPGTNIGAASPISGSGEDIPDTLEEKIFQDTAAFMRSIAERRERPSEPLEATVLEAKAYSAEEALELGIVDLLAGSTSELLELVDGRTVTVETDTGEHTVVLETRELAQETINMGLFDTILSFIADPNVSFLLLSIGSLGILAEILSPGLFFPGITGVVALVLAFAGLGNLPVNWAAVALILLAVALTIAEVNIAGFGVLGVGAIVSYILGGILLFAHFGTPSPTLPDIRVNPWVLGVAAGLVATVGGGLLVAMVDSRRRSGGSETHHLMGVTGVSVTALDPEGTVHIQGEDWTASAQGSKRIDDGQQVVVTAVEGLILTVKRKPRLMRQQPNRQATAQSGTGTETETDN